MRPTTIAVLKTFFKKGSRRWRPAQLLAEAEGLIDEGILDLELQELAKSGWVQKDEKNRYRLSIQGRTFQGEVFTRYEDAYVSLAPFGIGVRLGDFRKLKVLPGELVEVEITGIYPEELVGRIVRRLQPSSKTFIGRVEEGAQSLLVRGAGSASARHRLPAAERDARRPHREESSRTFSFLGAKVSDC
jgi:hypothetical protein